MTTIENRAYFRALGKHITELRKAHGLTQAELARAVGVSQQSVFAYELGDRRASIFVICKLARVLSVSIEDLAGMAKAAPARKSRVPASILHQAQRLQRLGRTQRRFVMRIVDLLLEPAASNAGSATVESTPPIAFEFKPLEPIRRAPTGSRLERRS